MSPVNLAAGTALTPAQLEAIAHGLPMTLSADHWQAVAACRNYLDT